MQYRFTDTINLPAGVDLPSVAMLFDGRYLEATIPGYLTLNVSGREFLAPELETLKIAGRAGRIIRQVKMPERVIRVHYSLRGKDPVDFMRKADQLRHILINGHLTDIGFRDDLGFSYKGIVVEMSEPPQGRLHYDGVISIYCPDPYKYSRPTTVKYTDLTNIYAPNTNGFHALFLDLDFKTETAEASIINAATGRQVVVGGAGTFVNETVRLNLEDGLHLVKVPGFAAIDDHIRFNLTDFDFLINAGDQLIINTQTDTTATLGYVWRAL